MKKILLSTSIAAVMGLSGCGGGDTVKEQDANTAKDKPYVRVVFDPATSNLNIPNDLLMIPNDDLFDFTLATEGSADLNPANPQHALSMLDGWSTNHPFQIRLTLAAGVDVNPATVGPTSIRLFQATQALEGTSATCQAIAAQVQAPGIPCELGDELQYGVDFVAAYTAGSGAISVVPLKPMKAAQGHMLVVTSELKDTDGKAVLGSSSWELARQDINTLPLSSPDQLQLQGLVNFLVNVLKPVGLEATQVSYAAYFSTQSTTSVLATIKQLQIGGFAQALQGALATGATLPAAQQFAAQYLPAIVTQAPVKGATAFEYLAPLLLPAEQLAQLNAVGLDTCAGLMNTLANPASPLFTTAQQTFTTAGPLCAAKRVEGTINLPYYLNPTNPLGDWWKAACTSGAMLKAMGAASVGALLQGGAAGPNNALCQAASGGQLFDLNLAAIGINDPRNVTKYSPIPQARGRNMDNAATVYNEAGTETLNVQFTVPDEAVIAALAAASGGAISPVTKPAGGWPVVVFQHGITGSKENVLAMSAALSLAGFASVAIDHPLHGEREFTLDNGDVVGASSHTPTDFMNLQSLLTARDNSRQSIVDTMALRLSLVAIADTTGMVDVNANDVHFIGQSLGAITGTGTVGLSNASLPESLASLNSMYHFNSAVFNVPAGGIASFLFSSADFGPLIKGSLLAASSDAFVQFLTQYAMANQLPVNDAIRPAFKAFEASLGAADLAAINATFAAFNFAAQTILDSADPISLAGITASNTPSLVQLMVGGGTNDDGSTALTDQVNSVDVPNAPLSGGNALANIIMGLPAVSSTTQGSGVVRFSTGEHQSLLTPIPSQAATTEMQMQAVGFFSTDGQTIVINNPAVVQN
ncbi:VolA/Pla-1 family phospholipase [Paraglaciecola hydrolytica]|uniref:Lipase n=1 Tax=Paraglaciecola hydrolytica TaxID=1799789 RepID=A0A136A6F0_9ALTE|nr:VolA/Pla-1 family phospholipase [Paraglaciecola hydrolytica]KXI30812.1 lipase [Paraglaciecola hydrolytica]